MNNNTLSDQILAAWSNKDGKSLELPCQHQITDPIKHRTPAMPSEDEDAPQWNDTPGKVIAVHFFPGKVKYDLELSGWSADATRIYNVDSTYVLKPDDNSVWDKPFVQD